MGADIVVNNDNASNSPKAAITTNINARPPAYARTSGVRLVLEPMLPGGVAPGLE
jgi:hypothetical protein